MKKLFFIFLSIIFTSCVTTNENFQKEFNSQNRNNKAKFSASGDIDDIFFEKEISSMDKKTASFKNHEIIYEDLKRTAKIPVKKTPNQSNEKKKRKNLRKLKPIAVTAKLRTKNTTQKNSKKIEEELFSSNDPLFNKEFGFDQVGTSSWYGLEKEKLKTSSGENFNPNTLTASHSNLPVGSIIRISNLENDREAVARINHNTSLPSKDILSVSEKIAEVLDFKDKKNIKIGLNIIKIGNKEDNKMIAQKDEYSVIKQTKKENKRENKPEILKIKKKKTTTKKKKVSRARKLLDKPEYYTVQLGAFSNVKLATKFRNRIKMNYKEKVYFFSRDNYYLVQIGNFKTRYEAENFKNKIDFQDCDKCFISYPD